MSFSLPEVLQTIYRRKHSGTLEITQSSRAKRIYFHQGDVYLLRLEEVTSDFAEGFLDEDAVELVEGTFGSLVDRGLVTEDEISDALALEIKEELWEVFRWEGANFRFTRNALPPEFFSPNERVTRLMLHTEQFLLETIRRLEEWESLRERCADARAVYGFTSFERKMAAIQSGRMSAEVLYLLDGTRPLCDVVRLSGLTQVEVYRAIAELVDAGALEEMGEVGADGTGG